MYFKATLLNMVMLLWSINSKYCYFSPEMGSKILTFILNIIFEEIVEVMLMKNEYLINDFHNFIFVTITLLCVNFLG